jgi:hypothetical protein
MTLKSSENSFGAWAFLIGVIISIIVGIGTSSFLSITSLTKYSTQIYAVLVLLGLFVGFSINITGKDSQTFLIAGTILVVVSKFGMESVTGSLIGIGIGNIVSSVFGALLILFVPATIIVALKTVFSLSNI